MTDATPATRRLRVMMLGLRGCPNVQGGVERHVEELGPRLAALGAEVEVVARAPYVGEPGPHRWEGITVHPLPATRRRSLEALLHTALGVLHAARRRPDVLHVHAIGPALFVPLARLLGLTVVVTHHGFDYDRHKWGRAARALLRLGERWGMAHAHARIAVSEAVGEAMRRRYRVPVEAIPNGVALDPAPASAGTLARFGLERHRYVVMVGRLVPEKRHLDLVAAFERAGVPGWKLALVGGADHPDAYSRAVEAAAAASPGVVATGFQTGLALRELVAHAGLFALPSSHEGLPIALLEALAYEVPAIASDIPANREVGLAAEAYVPVGDVEALSRRLAEAMRAPRRADQGRAERERVAATYDWDRIAERTLAVYRAAAGRGARRRGHLGEDEFQSHGAGRREANV